MSPRIVQLRLASADATSAHDARCAAAEWRRSLELRIASSTAWKAVFAERLGVPAESALQDVGDRCVFVVEHADDERLAAATAAVEQLALTTTGGRVVPIVAALDADPAADAHATVDALHAVDAAAARAPFSTQLRNADAFGPFSADDESAQAATESSGDAGGPIACVVVALDPLRPAPAGEHGACSFLTWLLLQQTGHDLLDGIVAHHSDRFAPSRALVCGDRASFVVDLRDALAFVEAIAGDAANEWRTSISIALTFARDAAGSDAATSRAWSALSAALARGERGSLVVDDVRIELSTIARQRELATGLERLARRAPGPMRELAVAAARLVRQREHFDLGEWARLRGAIHAVAAKSGVNARRARGAAGADPAIAALSALVAESARGFESGEAVLPLSYAVWMASMPAAPVAEMKR